MTTDEVRRLVKLGEESAEVIQAAAKVLLHGWENNYDSGETNAHALEREIGDFMAIMHVMVERNNLNYTAITHATIRKIEKLKALGF